MGWEGPPVSARNLCTKPISAHGLCTIPSFVHEFLLGFMPLADFPRSSVRPARLFRVRGCSPLPSSAVIVRAGLPPMGSREAAATGLARTMRGPFCMPPLARGTARTAE